MKDDEQGPSEDEDSEATVLPAGGGIDESPLPPEGGSGEGPSPGVGDTIDGKPVVAEFNMDRMLDPDISWVCIGLHRKRGEVQILALGDDWPSRLELLGFVHKFVRPEIVIDQIEKSQ